MGRDFKEEYTEYMAAQTPDLWARIESELPVAKKRKKRFLSRYAPIGATAAILLIGVCAAPFYLGTFRFGSHDGKKSESADMLWQNEADADSDGEDTGSGGGDGAEYFVNGSSKREEEGTAEDTAGMGTADEAAADGEMADEAKPAAPEQKEQSRQEADTESMTDGIAAVEDALGAEGERRMRVKILTQGEEEENGWIRYRALEEESGEQVELLLSGETEKRMETALQPGKVYLISACRQEDSYLILSAEQER